MCLSEDINCVSLNPKIKFGSCTITAVSMYFYQTQKSDHYLKRLGSIYSRSFEAPGNAIDTSKFEEIVGFSRNFSTKYPNVTNGSLLTVVAVIKLRMVQASKVFEHQVLKMLLISTILMIHTPIHLRALRLEIDEEECRQFLILQRKYLKNFSQIASALLSSNKINRITGLAPLLHDFLDVKYMLLVSWMVVTGDKESIKEILGLDADICDMLSHIWNFIITGTNIKDSWEVIPDHSQWKELRAIVESKDPKPCTDSYKDDSDAFYDYLR